MSEVRASVPEPPPKNIYGNRGVEVTPKLIEWIRMNGKIPKDIRERTMRLIEQRKKYGEEKYGMSLMLDNERNHVVDAEQEMGDLFQYVFAALMKGMDISRIEEFAIVLWSLLHADRSDIRVNVMMEEEEDKQWYSS